MNIKRYRRWRSLRRLNRNYKCFGYNTYFKILDYKNKWNKGNYQRALNSGDSMVSREYAYDEYWDD